MLIGNRYADNKLYRGLKYYDHLPLTSGDIHEYADILQMKNAYFMNNLLGSGNLNEPDLIISQSGISLSTPTILLIDGDISLIQAEGEILTISDIESSGISEGVLCIVGWYQSLNSTSTLRAYGGVRNSILENDILDKNLKMELSTRYQLRWDLLIIDKETFNSESLAITFNLINRDDTGETTTGSTQVTTYNKINGIRVATKPSTMDYAVSDLFIAPILQYTYNNSVLSGVKPVKSLKPSGGVGEIIRSSVEPTEDLEEGIIWYNPDNSRFKFYLENIGFVPTASDIALLQYSNTEIISSVSSSNTLVSIGIPSYAEGDILQVIYEGVVLTEDLHYSISTEDQIVTLLDFETSVGDKITFIVTKLVDVESFNTISSEFSTHVNSVGGNSKGHVSLSDTISPTLDLTKGVAATPKLVYDATTIIDQSTGKKYRLVVNNGALGVVEI